MGKHGQKGIHTGNLYPECQPVTQILGICIGQMMASIKACNNSYFGSAPCHPSYKAVCHIRRRVQCAPPTSIAIQVDANSGNDGWLRLQITVGN